MRKIFLVTAFVALALVSCKKDSSKTNPPVNKTAVNTFSASINDTSRSFTKSLSAKFYNDIDGVPGQILNINGGTSNTAESLEIQVSSIDNIKKGEYVTVADSANNPLIIDVKNVDSYNTVAFITNSYNPMSIVITSITSTNVQGTFSGVLRGETGSDPTETITNGRFNVNITPQ